MNELSNPGETTFKPSQGTETTVNLEETTQAAVSQEQATEVSNSGDLVPAVMPTAETTAKPEEIAVPRPIPKRMIAVSNQDEASRRLNSTTPKVTVEEVFIACKADVSEGCTLLSELGQHVDGCNYIDFWGLFSNKEFSPEQREQLNQALELGKTKQQMVLAAEFSKVPAILSTCISITEDIVNYTNLQRLLSP